MFSVNSENFFLLNKFSKKFNKIHLLNALLIIMILCQVSIKNFISIIICTIFNVVHKNCVV